MIGISCYALEDFKSAKKYLKKALTSLQNQEGSDDLLVAEILNNLGCIYYETGHQMKAIKLFEESLTLQHKVVFAAEVTLCKQMLMKIAVTQANIGYVHYELKNADAALAAFQICQKVSTFMAS